MARYFKIFLTAVLAFVAAVSVLSGCAGDRRVVPANLRSPGGVEGYLTDTEGNRMPGAVVYFYTEEKPGFRGPADFMAEPADYDGYYITELPPGRYWAVARKRLSGEISGNLREGDYHTLGAQGPIEVPAGGYAMVDLELARLTGNMLFNVFAGHGDMQGVAGVVRGRDGKPFARAYAFAYKDPRMAGKPDYVSEWTGDDGGYVIYVHEPGVYYIGARTGFKGVPRPEEPYGRYDGDPEHSVEVRAGGFVEGVDITLKKFSSGQ